VILSESAAQNLFPGQDPLGHTVQLMPSMYADASVVGANLVQSEWTSPLRWWE